MENSEHATENDPYYVYKDELNMKIDKAKSTAQLYTSQPELESQLKREITSAENAVKFLEQTVNMVERKRAQFKHIQESEIETRRAFIRGVQNELIILGEVVKGTVQASVQSHGVEERGLMINQKRRQELEQESILRHQDDNLNSLGKSVSRLGHVAVHIHDEVDAQNKMLDDLDQDMENAKDSMNVVMYKMGKFLHTKDRCQIGTILLLSCILFVLFFLVLYT